MIKRQRPIFIWLRRIFFGFLALILLLLLIVCVRSFSPGALQNQQLPLERATIPPGANCFDALQVAASKMWLPKDQEQRIDDLVSSINWDEAFAQAFLASNHDALASWDAAVKLPDLQVPELSAVYELPPYLEGWKKLARIAMVRENWLLHHGQDQAAFNQLIDHVRLGRRMQNSQCVLIVYLVGQAVDNMGLFQMRHWVGKTQLTADQLKTYIAQLKPQPRELSDAFASTIKVEHQMQVNTLAAMRDGRIDNGYIPRIGFGWPFFNFGQTEELFTQGTLKLVEAASHHYVEVDVAAMTALPSRPSIYLSGNMTGQILYYSMMPAMTAMLANKCKGDVTWQATRTILALRAYQLAHGQLPSDLNALVPEYLETLPVDDFNGRPLHYAPDRKIVYSVGQNLKDDGGDDHDSVGEHPLDLVYKFDF